MSERGQTVTVETRSGVQGVAGKGENSTLQQYAQGLFFVQK